MSDSEDPIDPLDEGGDDLFGDEGDDEIASPKERVLDDDDLASDPEGDTYARYRDDDQAQPEVKDRVVMAVQTYRHRIPKPKDGAVSLPASHSTTCAHQPI
jgi:RNA polymerase-associated protein LEO1